jgi:protoporphyrinogen oxidase
MRIGVLGGGALGLTTAYRLAQGGHHAIVLERDRILGGLAGSFEVGGNHLEKFYHHLFKTDKIIVDLIEEVGLGEKALLGKAQDEQSDRRESLPTRLGVERAGVHSALASLTPSAWARRRGFEGASFS